MRPAPDLRLDDPEDVLVWRELARRRLSWFSRYRIANEGSGIQWVTYLEAICEFLEAMDAGEISRGIINIPPRHRKSETVQDLHAWLIGKDPSKQSSLMNISYSAELAHDESRYCRQILSTDWYQSLFPEVLIEASADKRWSVSGGAQRFATGVGGTITGRGSNWIIVDDPIKPDEADSETVRNKANQWLGRTLRSRLNDPKKGRVLIIMQRLHEKDAVGYMEELADKGGSQWEKLVLPLKATRTTVVMMPGRDFVWKREQGELLEPDRIGEREYRLLEIDMPHDFEGQYQQNPVKETGNFFRPDMLVEVDEDAMAIREKHQLRPGAWVDLASKEKETQSDDPDESVIAIMAKDRLRRLWILDMWGGTDDQWKFAQTIIEYDRKWGRLTWRAPKEALMHTLQPTLRVASRTMNHPMVVTPMEGLSGDKVQRAQTLRAMVNTGQVYVPKAAPWLPTLKRWLRAFPKAAHDDWVDAPAYGALDMELGMRTGGEQQMPDDGDFEMIAGRKVRKRAPDLRSGDRPWRD